MPVSGLPSTPSDNDYLDLSAGGSLRITVPSFKSGGYVAKQATVKEENGALSVSQTDLVGFQISHYSIEERANGKVQLKFKSAQTTIDGKEHDESKSPTLPFDLPQKSGHVRLIYFVRSSQADHDMAIAAATDLSALNAFTGRLKVDSQACQDQVPVRCIWVPRGISVRPD